MTPSRDRKDRDLGPVEQLLDHDRAGHSVELGKPCLDLGLGLADDDALACSEAVSLEDTWGDCVGERPGQRHAGRHHHRLRECLRALDRGCSSGWAEDRDSDRPEHIGEPGDERHLRPDDDELDVERTHEPEHGLGVVAPHRVALPERGDPGVTRGCVKLGQKRGLDELPGEGVLAATGSDEEDAHRASLLGLGKREHGLTALPGADE